uniref:Uncharacterized protein n=1 Tax=viral metagenome TaxID=1070528 RepID=A0A6M3JKC8_9ZZZZ
MACKCVSCPECGGSGIVWVSFSGKYMGKHRCDDLDEMERCDFCYGSGISEECDECLDAWYDDECDEY